MTHFSSCTPSSMSLNEFVDQFGEVYEHSPWIAKSSYQQGLSEKDDDIEFLHQRMAQVLIQADRNKQLGVICAHPDLAGRAAIEKQLSHSSHKEQAGAGLSQCTLEEFKLFTELNDRYKSRFNFPFIMAVRGANKAQIIDGFKTRIDNEPEFEFALALEEVNKIALFRLRDM
ncbi:2-oxo-4-hydroxy-4-carboxy-5-ureidoimidazoline decarboxylase [Vibrio aquimaris]|uniref:2-oxo-4-hydroxy-4-carboxy-5-ureidoimidazoline decarboxylase n=1 Tax=Vibrio aquimaris TaxID=2587862 RepID=A0A5P9CRL7_9VIBR|nr:2-oxo-4-hydroxy-4-carboxy-5-ureidoimidazoline decarboxylase [Vibrio aquimaris]QFT28437.1 Uric acid degradation bifunctional protein PucL [Vibrio aquimaris]